MKDRVAVFSTGIPDPTQGGSGIFNYYTIRELLNGGYLVDAYLRVSDAFRFGHTVQTHLDELSGQGLNVKFVTESRPRTRGKLGFALLRGAHQVAVCESVVREIVAGGPQYKAFIAHDLGWILALAGHCRPLVGIIGDPLHARLIHGQTIELVRPRTWVLRLQAKSTAWPSTFRAVAKRLNSGVICGSFSPQHAREFEKHGIRCRHFGWFSPEVAPPLPRPGHVKRGKLVLLHVGTLASTASYAMIRYWQERLLPELGSMPFPLEIRFVGRTERTFESPSPNLTLTFLGHSANVDQEFEQCDLFFSPMKYPVGTRTRILTAMSYGVPVLADSSASLGLPELEAGKHIFFADTAEEIRAILTSIHSGEKIVADVSRRARELWEAKFNPVANVAAILEAVGLCAPARTQSEKPGRVQAIGNDSGRRASNR